MTQSTTQILMIRPANFGFNAETAENNAFQSLPDGQTSLQIQESALIEFDAMVEKLAQNNIQVLVVEDTQKPIKPDAIFPNNWISTHQNGAIITYPMWAKNRRIERREDIVELIIDKFRTNNRYSFEFYEEEDEPMFLEGTGSMIIDHKNNIVYACRSPRTDARLLDKFSVLMDMENIIFNATDAQGQEIYHTNVMMAIGLDFVVICLDSVQNEVSKKKLLDSFARTHKQVVDITLAQMEHFAGNMLEVLSIDGKRYLVMSETAYNALTTKQIETLQGLTNLLPISIPTIEKYGGGSVRCMMAEIFLPKK
ncbi:MAG: arginine deiminase-related protein [Saprospiraceae bacterium]